MRACKVCVGSCLYLRACKVCVGSCLYLRACKVRYYQNIPVNFIVLSDEMNLFNEQKTQPHPLVLACDAKYVNNYLTITSNQRFFAESYI